MGLAACTALNFLGRLCGVGIGIGGTAEFCMQLAKKSLMDPIDMGQLKARGAQYPAEHNVGHIYKAKPALAAHYLALDPTNCFNPGVGGTERDRRSGTSSGAA